MPAKRTPTEVSKRSWLRRETQPMASDVADGRDGPADVERPAQHVGDDEARERRMADRIADERQALEDHERAHHGAHDADHEGRQQGALHEGVARADR